MPIADKIIRNCCGRVVNSIEMPRFTFGKEMQLHVLEIKANKPYRTATEFEKAMQNAVSTVNQIAYKHGAMLLGTGMHPLLKLGETSIWPHYHKKIYQEYGKIFNLNQHGWLNIQSFHLNLPYYKEADAVQAHNQLANLCAYLPAISASSPIFECEIGPDIDNRLQFYRTNQIEIPSVTGDVIPKYMHSFTQYRQYVIDSYSSDLEEAGAGQAILYRDWVNSRGVIFRFDRSAIEIRVMDEQECIKSDVALACFIRATLRGLISSNFDLLPHDLLVKDFNSVVKYGLNATVSNSNGKTAKQICQIYLKLAIEYAEGDEKKYLWLIKKRIQEGNLSELIRSNVLKLAPKEGLHQAIIDVYSTLIKCLSDNEPYT